MKRHKKASVGRIRQSARFLILCHFNWHYSLNNRNTSVSNLVVIEILVVLPPSYFSTGVLLHLYLSIPFSLSISIIIYKFYVQIFLSTRLWFSLPILDVFVAWTISISQQGCILVWCVPSASSPYRGGMYSSGGGGGCLLAGKGGGVHAYWPGASAPEPMGSASRLGRSPDRQTWV